MAPFDLSARMIDYLQLRQATYCLLSITARRHSVKTGIGAVPQVTDYATSTFGLAFFTLPSTAQRPTMPKPPPRTEMTYGPFTARVRIKKNTARSKPTPLKIYQPYIDKGNAQATGWIESVAGLQYDLQIKPTASYKRDYVVHWFVDGQPCDKSMGCKSTGATWVTQTGKRLPNGKDAHFMFTDVRTSDDDNAQTTSDLGTIVMKVSSVTRINPRSGDSDSEEEHGLTDSEDIAELEVLHEVSVEKLGRHRITYVEVPGKSKYWREDYKDEVLVATFRFVYLPREKLETQFPTLFRQIKLPNVPLARTASSEMHEDMSKSELRAHIEAQIKVLKRNRRDLSAEASSTSGASVDHDSDGYVPASASGSRALKTQRTLRRSSRVLGKPPLEDPRRSPDMESDNEKHDEEHLPEDDDERAAVGSMPPQTQEGEFQDRLPADHVKSTASGPNEDQANLSAPRSPIIRSERPLDDVDLMIPSSASAVVPKPETPKPELNPSSAQLRERLFLVTQEQIKLTKELEDAERLEKIQLLEKQLRELKEEHRRKTLGAEGKRPKPEDDEVTGPPRKRVKPANRPSTNVDDFAEKQATTEVIDLTSD